MRSSRFAFPLAILALSSSHSGTRASQAGPGAFASNGIVDREKNAVDAHFLHAQQKRRIGEEAAGGNGEVRREDIAELHRLLPGPRQAVVDAPEQERQAFPKVTKDELGACAARTGRRAQGGSRASRSRPCSPRRRAAARGSPWRTPYNRCRSPPDAASRGAGRSARRAPRRARRSASSACRR